MRYVSTRGQAPALTFSDAMLTGLALDGGLYVPEAWPTLTAAEFADLAGAPYIEIAARVMRPFLGDAFPDEELRPLLEAAYAPGGPKFPCAVAPLTQIDESLWLLGLSEGPTLAFKDMAMQLIGRLFDAELTRRGETLTIVGATSGDTGSAAIEAFRGLSAVKVYILYPHGRVSEVQRRQMTTPTEENVQAVAVDGSFDDCQALVKAMFNDRAFREEMRLGAVNSINWARVLAQLVYYVTSAVALGAPHRPVSFCVPSGNFGNIFAGYIAKQMGLPIDGLLIAANENDILHRTLETGRYQVSGVKPTITPSMDIQVSSNFERLLFDLHDRAAEAVRGRMDSLKQSGGFSLAEAAHARLQASFQSARADETETLATIREVYEASRVLIDPHTAVGVAAARKTAAMRDRRTPMIVHATAHPAKFPDAVAKATGVRPSLPAHLADLYERPERIARSPNALEAVQGLIRG